MWESFFIVECEGESSALDDVYEFVEAYKIRCQYVGEFYFSAPAGRWSLVVDVRISAVGVVYGLHVFPFAVIIAIFRAASEGAWTQESDARGGCILSRQRRRLQLWILGLS